MSQIHPRHFQYVQPSTTTCLQYDPTPVLRTTVMSWNTLADSLCTPESFSHTDPRALDWHASRKNMIEQELFPSVDAGRDAADIIALQEVDEVIAHTFLAQLCTTRHYHLLYAKKNSDENTDGCALLIRKDCWEIVHECTLPLGSIDTTTQIALVAHLRRVHVRPAAAAVMSMEDECDADLVVATVHLKAKVGHEQKRRNQMQHLLDFLTTQQQHPNLATIVLGDFNDTPDSPVVKYMSHAMNGFCSAYSLSDDTLYTTAKKRASVIQRTIDYIWIRATKKKNRHVVVEGVLAVPEASVAFPDWLPCLTYPSDHLAIAARVVIY